MFLNGQWSEKVVYTTYEQQVNKIIGGIVMTLKQTVQALG